MPEQPSVESMVERMARAIAEAGTGVIWGDVLEHNYREPDMADMRNLARAAIASLPSPEAPIQDEAERYRAGLEKLGPPSDWKEKAEELLQWTGSAFLAGETHPSDLQTKGELYSWLCGLIGWFGTAEEVSALAALPLPPQESR